jgi:hypothetical protein
MGEWRYSSTILDLETRWRWVISFTFLPLHPRGKIPGIHWRGGWEGPRTGQDTVEERKMFLLPGIEYRPSSPSLYLLVLKKGSALFS